MIKNSALTLVGLLTTCISYGQPEKVKEWKTSHPDVLLIEQVDSNPIFIESLEAKNRKYIVYQGEFSMSNVQEFQQKYDKVKSSLSEDELTKIKIWKANHPEVILISQKDFNAMSTEKKEITLQKEVLIYTGFELKFTQILDYDEKL